MYAFRKPFAAATYATADGLDYKVWLVIAQTCGYAFSKFLGIRLIGQLSAAARQPLLLRIVGGAWLSWLGFALLPDPFRWPMLFCNGLLLGLVWGVVFSYLEGRRGTEAMAALLAASLIFSSALVKAVGKQLLLMGVEVAWMPFAVAAIFVLPLLYCVRQLAQLPPPSREDQGERMPRRALQVHARRRLLRSLLPGLLPLGLGYVAVGVLRDMRDSFEADLLAEFGHGGSASLFVWLELPATIAALLLAGSLVRVREHPRCLWRLHCWMALGLAGVLGVTVLCQARVLSPLAWLTLTGLCLSMAYVPFNCAFFERLIATFRIRGNVGFFAYLFDTAAYFGSCSVLLAAPWGWADAGWAERLGALAIVLPLIGGIGVLVSLQYFQRRYRQRHAGRREPQAATQPLIPQERFP